MFINHVFQGNSNAIKYPSRNAQNNAMRLQCASCLSFQRLLCNNAMLSSGAKYSRSSPVSKRNTYSANVVRASRNLRFLGMSLVLGMFERNKGLTLDAT